MLHLVLAVALVAGQLSPQAQRELMSIVRGNVPCPRAYPANTVFPQGVFFPNVNEKGVMKYGVDVKMELSMPFKEQVRDQCIVLATRLGIRYFFAKLTLRKTPKASIWLCKDWGPCSRSIISAMVDPQGVYLDVMRICMLEDLSPESVLLAERYDTNGAQGKAIKTIYGENQSRKTGVHVDGLILGPFQVEKEQFTMTGTMVDGLEEGHATVTWHQERQEHRSYHLGVPVGEWFRGPLGGPATEHCVYNPDGTLVQDWTPLPAPAA